MRFHDLRHSAATLLLSQGTHPKVVQELLGHSQIAVTMDVYSHVLPTFQQEAMADLRRVTIKPKVQAPGVYQGPVFRYKFLVAGVGLEPTTFGL